MESVIFNYLRESLKLEQGNGTLNLMLRNPDGKWIEVSSVRINSPSIYTEKLFSDNLCGGNRYLSNDD